MKIAVCITTMNRPDSLDGCLSVIYKSKVKPYAVIISDNSINPDIQRKNQLIAQRYPGTAYLEGPHTGVTANRNNALDAVPEEADKVIFLADDIHVSPDFFKLAILRYEDLHPEDREKIILTGDNLNEFSPPDIGALGVSFRGYFCPWKPSIPQVVNLYSSLFPKSFFDKNKWDENIFLGQEDIEISLRALKQEYRIIYCQELKVYDTLFAKTSLPSAAHGSLKDYEIYVAASRLYIGIKRYKYIFPNTFKLMIFKITYYLHMTTYLLRRNSLHSWPRIIEESNIELL